MGDGLKRAFAATKATRYPKISDEATELIDSVMRATEEEVAETMVALHRYIEKLEKRRQRTRQ